MSNAAEMDAQEIINYIATAPKDARQTVRARKARHGGSSGAQHTRLQRLPRRKTVVATGMAQGNPLR